MLTLLDTGVRCSELVQLELADLDLEGGWLRVLHGCAPISRNTAPASLSGNQPHRGRATECSIPALCYTKCRRAASHERSQSEQPTHGTRPTHDSGPTNEGGPTSSPDQSYSVLRRTNGGPASCSSMACSICGNSRAGRSEGEIGVPGWDFLGAFSAAQGRQRVGARPQWWFKRMRSKMPLASTGRQR